MLMGKQSNNLRKQSRITARYMGQNNQYMEQANKKRSVRTAEHVLFKKRCWIFFRIAVQWTREQK